MTPHDHHGAMVLHDMNRRLEEEAHFALPVLLSVIPHAFVVFRKVPAPPRNHAVRVRLALYTQS